MHEDSINNEDFSPSSINPASEADQEQRRLPFLDDVTTDFAPTSEFNVRESAISKVSAKREKEYLGAIPYWDRLRGEGPCYVIDLARFRKNLQTLRLVSDNSGAKILLALKAFSMHQTFPLIQKYLHGACTSSLHEARLAHEKMGGETHYYSPALKESDIPAITRYADHVIFNSVNQWCRFAPMVKASERSISCGIRINPEYSVAKSSVYDPCAPQSRLGITFAELEENKERMQGIEGLHFHNLCQQGAGVLAETLEIVERRFGEYLKKVNVVKFRRGQHLNA
jgi:carboxynorspermidine decarboxylase